VGSQVPGCWAAIDGGAVEITDGQITATRLFIDGELGDEDAADIFRVLPDGSSVPLAERMLYAYATSVRQPS